MGFSFRPPQRRRILLNQDGSSQTPPDGRFDDGAVEVFHAAHDRLYSVIALLDEVGSVVERVRYSAYGHARQQSPPDANGDGSIDSTDYNLVLTAFSGHIARNSGGNSQANYSVHVDLDGGGVAGAADLLAVLNNMAKSSQPPPGLFASVASASSEGDALASIGTLSPTIRHARARPRPPRIRCPPHRSPCAARTHR